MSESHFASVAKSVQDAVTSRIKTSSTDRDADWQRVNSYIADVLKDAHVLYAKLARLQGDFAGAELDGLEKISEDVLDIGGKLSSFSRAFYQGKASMSETESFGEEETFGGSPSSEDGGGVDVDFDYGEGEGEPEEEHEEQEQENQQVQ
jgi:hypothetical protein